MVVLIDWIGGFSFVYLVKELADTAQGGGAPPNSTGHGNSSVKTSRSGSNGSGGAGAGGSAGAGAAAVVAGGGAGAAGGGKEKKEMVLKVTSILSRQQRDIAEKEAKLLSRVRVLRNATLLVQRLLLCAGLGFGFASWDWCYVPHSTAFF